MTLAVPDGGSEAGVPPSQGKMTPSHLRATQHMMAGARHSRTYAAGVAWSACLDMMVGTRRRSRRILPLCATTKRAALPRSSLQKQGGGLRAPPIRGACSRAWQQGHGGYARVCVKVRMKWRALPRNLAIPPLLPSQTYGEESEGNQASLARACLREATGNRDVVSGCIIGTRCAGYQ